MNLVTCSEPCVHQVDGFCRLEQPASVCSVRIDGCCYFKQADTPEPGQVAKDIPEGTS